MRALFCFAGGSGHALPMMPTARALTARGHEVLFTCQPAMLESIRRAGFDVADSGGPTLAAPTDRLDLVRTDRNAEAQVLRNFFAGRVAPERAGKIVGVARRFRADVIVRDEVDFGAAVAADRLGIPHVSVVVLAAGGMITPGLLDEPLSRVRAEFGLPPAAGFLDRFLTLAPVMPSFRNPETPLPVASLAIRPEVLDHRHVLDDPAIGRLDAWLQERPGRPLVYFTLGTVFHQESGDLFPRIVSGLEGLAVNVVVTVGREIDPAELGPRSDHVLIERFLPQHALLPRAAAVVSHAGSGTVVSSLACGVPLVLLPMGADQPLNADRCEQLGVGVVLDALTVSSRDAAAAVHEVLTVPSYRSAAGATRMEAEALAPADVGAAAVERLIS